MRLRIGIRLIAVLAAGLLLAGCAGLPTSGPPNAGLPVGEDGDATSFTPIARGPEPGAGPEEIVSRFLEASMTPRNNWEIAHQFLTEEFSPQWDPDSGVAIDSSILTREFTSTVDADDESATTAEVTVQLEQIAGVDGDGAYTAAGGTAKATYRLVRPEGGEWRISEAQDGITLDIGTFGQVYEKFSLKYFDPNWSHLVPDVRWFPRLEAMASTVTRSLISGTPSDWLDPAVRTAFPADVSLVGDAVPIDSSRVASVSLSRSALSASGTVLARMRTQLEESLAGTGVAEVRFFVEGAPLDAGTVSLDQPITDPGVLVQTSDAFGTASAGEVAPVTGLSAQIDAIADPLRSIDVSLDALLAATQLQDGHVHAVRDGRTVELDSRSGLIVPSLDPYGYVWSVPRGAPADLQAWSTDVVPHSVAGAWPGAEQISHVRVAADGARVAAIVTNGGQHRLLVASIIRDEVGVPLALSSEIPEIAVLNGPGRGLAWVGSDSVAVLTTAPDSTLTTYVIGGPASSSPAPVDAISLAGARTTTGLRVLSDDGSVYALRGSSWQKAVEDVLVLGTRAGY